MWAKHEEGNGREEANQFGRNSCDCEAFHSSTGRLTADLLHGRKSFVSMSCAIAAHCTDSASLPEEVRTPETGCVDFALTLDEISILVGLRSNSQFCKVKLVEVDDLCTLSGFFRFSQCSITNCWQPLVVLNTSATFHYTPDSCPIIQDQGSKSPAT